MSAHGEVEKIFYPMNERVGAMMEVVSNVQKKGKHKYLVLTVTITRPSTVQLYIVKLPEHGEPRSIPLCTPKNMKRLDCRDSKTQPTYDLQLITDYKTWNFRATKLESKSAFISSFCRIIGSLDPQRFKDIQLVNIPSSVEISTTRQYHSLESLLNPSDDQTKSDGTDTQGPSVLGGAASQEAYRPLTDREEEDIRHFLNEMTADSVQMNAAELTELLQKQLADMEGTNIHSIMESETQVLRLMATLDCAIDQAEKLENQMITYHQFISDVEEAMSALQDRDQLTQITTDNRGRLLKTLEQLVSNLTLDAKYMRRLLEVKLEKPSDIVQCTEAARYLDALLNSSSIPGKEHLMAVEEVMLELRRLRDSFAAELAKRVNNHIVNFARQLKFVVNVGGSSDAGDMETGSQLSLSRNNLSGSMMIRSATELYKVQRDELIQLAPLIGGWLQANRNDVCNELKREYIRQVQPFFHNRTSDLLNRAQNAINNIIRPPKSGHASRSSDILSNDGVSVMSIHSPEGSALSQVVSVVDVLFTQLRSMVSAEEQFFSQFFNLPLCASLTSLSYTPADVQSLGVCMCGLFSELENDTLTFISACEQIQPILIMPLLVVISRHADSVTHPSARSASDEVARQLDVSGVEYTSFLSHYLCRLTMFTKRSFNRFVDRFIQSFKDSKPSKKSRCGVIRIVRNYVEFAESYIVVFSPNARLIGLERAHAEMIRALMDQLEHIASESVKTPREVVQLENYHRLCDIIRRLKMPGLEEYLHEAKNRYTRALEEYTKNCMGRPLDKLATFFDGVQTALTAGIRPELIQYQFAFSKQELKKVIREYPGREIKRGLESLCKKVEKHLSTEGNLFQVVWRSIQAEFFDQYRLFNDLIKECYPESGIALEFTVNDLQNYFTEIARHDRPVR